MQLSQANAASRDAMLGRRVHAENAANLIGSSEGDHLGPERLRQNDPALWAHLSRQNPHGGGTYNPVWTEQGRGTHLGRYDQGLATVREIASIGAAYAEQNSARYQVEYNRIMERHNQRMAEMMDIPASGGAAFSDSGAAQASLSRARERAGFLEHIHRTDDDALRVRRNAIAGANFARMVAPAGYDNQLPRNQGPDVASQRPDTRNDGSTEMMARIRGAPRLPTYVPGMRARQAGERYS